MRVSLVMVLLQMLGLDGWFVYEVACFAGRGLIVGAEHHLYGSIERKAESSAAEVALELFEDALALSGRGPLH